LGASNPINQVKATFEAIAQLSTRDEIKQRRGLGGSI
jgi:small subunit ribosomal protein S5